MYTEPKVYIEWDRVRNVVNKRKHGISFEEAQTVFYDPLTKVAHDTEHSELEDRFIAVGYSFMNRLLLVVHCYKKRDQIIRIISARKLTRKERKQFEESL